MTSQNRSGSINFELSLGRALSQAVRIRCPYCGEGRLFAGLFRMHCVCSECGTRLEREPGYFLGSTYINYGITAGFSTLTYVLLHIGLGWSNRVVMSGLMAFCLIFPLIFFRYARSLWLALDCFFDPLGAQQVILTSRRSESRDELSNIGI
ncbi:MAG: DUF983 domain-containing protein [Fuerstiella sp.]|nr:DUF983 domain-containing protein [Fuerstiella sp.]